MSLGTPPKSKYLHEIMSLVKKVLYRKSYNFWISSQLQMGIYNFVAIFLNCFAIPDLGDEEIKHVPSTEALYSIESNMKKILSLTEYFSKSVSGTISYPPLAFQ
eukprot:NODE_31_length_37178_cov_0.413576.p29 type:complete len:104 gc:universal NODE_31_length_37178_cov_0.413576:12717-12406(-)